MIRLLTLTLMLTIFSCTAPKPEGRFVGYEYSKHGSTAYPLENYKLYYNAEGELFIDVVTREGQELTVPAPAEIPDQIDAIVREYKLWKVKEYYRMPIQVLDGYSWHMYIRYENNSISTGGYHCWPPDKRRDGLLKINALLRSVVEEAGITDVAEPTE